MEGGSRRTRTLGDLVAEHTADIRKTADVRGQSDVCDNAEALPEPGQTVSGDHQISTFPGTRTTIHARGSTAYSLHPPID